MINACANVVLFFLMPMFGLLADRYGARFLLRVSGLYMVIVTLPVYALLALRTTASTIIAQLILAIGMAAFAPGLPVFMASLFPLHLRTSGIGIAYNLSQALFGGTTPLVCTALYLEGSTLYPAIWVVSTAILASLSLALTVNFTPSEQSDLASSNPDKGVTRRGTPGGNAVPDNGNAGPQSAITTNPMEISLNAL